MTTQVAPRGESVLAASMAIRELITGRQLVPGQQLRQDELSIRLGFSRGPTREALQALCQEGIISHAKNRGYVVASFDFFEMQQLYKVRDLVESEVLRSVPKPTAKQVSHLRSINSRLVASTETLETIRINDEFHFAIFEQSPYKLLLKESGRLWQMAAAYRALGFAVSSSPQERVMADAHKEIINAYARHDVQTLVELCRKHRDHFLEGLRRMLT